IHADLAAAGQRYLSQDSPSEILRRGAVDAVRVEHRDEALYVRDHQIQFVPAAVFGWMNGHFGRRQRKNEPPSAYIDAREPEHVTKERAIGLGIGAVDDRMSAVNHRHVVLVFGPSVSNYR